MNPTNDCPYCGEAVLYEAMHACAGNKGGGQFPIQRGDEARRLNLPIPRSIPWLFIVPHEAQALRNHGQSIQRLAERGGTSVKETLAIVRGLKWQEVTHLSEWKAWEELSKLIDVWRAKEEVPPDVTMVGGKSLGQIAWEAMYPDTTLSEQGLTVVGRWERGANAVRKAALEETTTAIRRLKIAHENVLSLLKSGIGDALSATRYEQALEEQQAALKALFLLLDSHERPE